MDADARAQRDLLLGAERREPALIRECERDGLYRPLEQEHEAVGLVDLAAAVIEHERAREFVVAANELRRALIAEPLDERGRVDEIGEHERAQHRGGARLLRVEAG